VRFNTIGFENDELIFHEVDVENVEFLKRAIP